MKLIPRAASCVRGVIFALFYAAAMLPASQAAAVPSEIERGEYLVRAGGCVSCHTDKKNGSEPFAGGRALKTPFGNFFSPNITPDENSGIGNWSDEDFISAVKKGIRPDGSHYFPVFPYTSYTLMTDQDALAIKAFLFSLPAVSKINKEHDVGPPFGWRWPLIFWKLMFFDEGEYTADETRDAEWNRGAYLATALSHCGECHTQRNIAGAIDRTMWMAGAQEGPEGDASPNITSAHTTGIGWSIDQLSFFLKSGTKPDWERADGLMGEAVVDGYKYLSDEDLRAIARYINELPPIENYITGY